MSKARRKKSLASTETSSAKPDLPKANRPAAMASDQPAESPASRSTPVSCSPNVIPAALDSGRSAPTSTSLPATAAAAASRLPPATGPRRRRRRGREVEGGVGGGIEAPVGGDGDIGDRTTRERAAGPSSPTCGGGDGGGGGGTETTTTPTVPPGTAAAAAVKRHSEKPPAQQQHSKKGGSSGGGGDGSSFTSTGKVGRRRRWLWRFIQWLLALGVVLLALAAVHRRLTEETPPWMVLELLQEGGLLGPLGPLAARLNVTLPPLPPLPRPSLDAIIASTGFNVSALLGLTDTLTDTLNDLTDTISAGRLSVTVRGLLSQLPAFSLPTSTGSNGSTATVAAGLRPGLVMARRGYRAKHPVVIVPGFVTSGLELWRGLPCGQRYFRQRMWGTLAMVQAFLADPGCWFRHMELDPNTGLDPAGIKIRAAVGLEAVDYFIQGYWVWGKLVEALADVGYDSNSLVSMPYDWRLAMPLLEERDGYFTRLRLTIEGLAEVSRERVVITAHSYGENVVRSFMSWVEADRPGWVESYVEAIANIAGTSLGVPKSVSALLSGETRDTAQLGALAGFLTSNLVPRATRTRVWRTWGASYAMLPVGGPRVWGNTSWAPDDTKEMRAEKRTYGAMVSLWPHDWETVLAAAASAPPHHREQLRQLVHSVGEMAEPPPPGAAAAVAGESTQGVAAAAALVAAAPDGASRNGSSSSSSNRNGNGSGSSSSSPMARITDTLMRLVSSGGSDIDPADYLDSDHVTRLDVSGFLALLREVGGPLVDQHMRDWSAVDLPGAHAASGAVEGESARRRATAAADSNSPQAEQSLGGPRRLHQSVRHRVVLFPDATRTPLPKAPTTAMVCLYGVGLPTERGYHYLRPPPPSPSPQPPGTAAAAAAAAAAIAAGGGGNCMAAAPSAGLSSEPEDGTVAAASAVYAGDDNRASDGGCGSGSGRSKSSSPPPRPPPHSPGASGDEANLESGPEAGGSGWTILKDVSDPGSSLDVGVQMSDGDGTVPLLSLGLMCRRGWRPGGSLNPGGMRVITREFKHRSVSLLQDARGGPATAAHIEILGNEAALQDVIRIAAGRLDELSDVIHSDIDRIAAAVEF